MPTEWLGLSTQTALERYVDIRAKLERVGTIIGEADLWIAAATCMADGILVTHNPGEFSRIPGLRLEDWLLD